MCDSRDEVLAQIIIKHRSALKKLTKEKLDASHAAESSVYRGGAVQQVCFAGTSVNAGLTGVTHSVTESRKTASLVI